MAFECFSAGTVILRIGKILPESSSIAYHKKMIEELEHREFRRCLKISNGEAEVMVSLDFGPRILHYALDGGDNIFGWHLEAAVKTELGTWKPYGGHRLWLAPENMPLSYAPDNEPLDYLVENELCALFSRATDMAGIEKQF